METAERVSEFELSNMPQAELAEFALDELRRVKDEVKDEKVDKNKSLLDRAVDNFDFVHRLREIPSVNRFILRGLRNDVRAIPFVKDLLSGRKITVSSDRIYMSPLIFDRNRDTLISIPKEILKHHWEMDDRVTIKKFARMSKVDIVKKFERAIK